MNNFTGLVLAGGRSSRMGQDKALLAVGNETLLDRNVRILTETGCQQVFISGDHQGNRQQPNAISDIQSDLGPVGGILSVMRQLIDSDHQWLMIVAVDMPNLSSQQLKPLLNDLPPNSNGRYFNDSLFPMVIKISRQHIETIEQQLAGNSKKSKSIYRLVHNISLEALTANDIQAQQFINVNTPQQWQQHLANQQHTQPHSQLKTSNEVTMGHLATKEFKPLNIAVLTVSDTRNESTDTSGKYLADSLIAAGHTLSDKQIVIDDVYKIRAVISQWVASDEVQVIITTGGTGFTSRDRTPEAIKVLFDREIEGFGELFRHISYTEIGTSTVQSRAFGGFANGTSIFSLPGSTGACRTGWEGILLEQLDIRHKPCNFAAHVKQV